MLVWSQKCGVCIGIVWKKSIFTVHPLGGDQETGIARYAKKSAFCKFFIVKNAKTCKEIQTSTFGLQHANCVTFTFLPLVDRRQAISQRRLLPSCGTAEEEYCRAGGHSCPRSFPHHRGRGWQHNRLAHSIARRPGGLTSVSKYESITPAIWAKIASNQQVLANAPHNTGHFWRWRATFGPSRPTVLWGVCSPTPPDRSHTVSQPAPGGGVKHSAMVWTRCSNRNAPPLEKHWHRSSLCQHRKEMWGKLFRLVCFGGSFGQQKCDEITGVVPTVPRKQFKMPSCVVEDKAKKNSSIENRKLKIYEISSRCKMKM